MLCYKCYLNVMYGILNESFVEIAFNFATFDDVKNAPILLRLDVGVVGDVFKEGKQ